MQILPIVLDYLRVSGKVVRPKELPDALVARGYNSAAARQFPVGSSRSL